MRMLQIGNAVLFAIILWLGYRIASMPAVDDVELSSDVASVEESPTPTTRPDGGPEPLSGRSENPTTDSPVSAPSSRPTFKSVALYGAVRTKDGAPIKTTRVDLTSIESAARTIANASTKGAYSAMGLAPDTYLLKCTADGFRTVEREITVAATDAFQREDIVMDPAVVLRVRYVTPDGKRLEDALRSENARAFMTMPAVVATTDPPDGDFPLSSRRDLRIGVGEYRDGTYSPIDAKHVPAQCDGTIQLTVDLPVYLSAHLRSTILETKRITNAEDIVTFTISVDAFRSRLAVIKARIVDAESGAPIPKAIVDAGTTDMSSRTTIAEDGRVTITDVVPGLIKFAVWADNCAPYWKMLRVGAGQTVDLGTIKIDKGTTIEGVLVDSHGVPRKGKIAVAQLDLFDFPQEPRGNSDAVADAQGRFKIERAPRGRLRLTADNDAEGNPPDERAVLVVSTATGPITGLKVELRATQKFTLIPKIGPNDLVFIEIADAAGTPFFMRPSWGPSPQPAALPVGDYVVRIFDGDRLKRTTPLKIDAETKRVVLEM